MAMAGSPVLPKSILVIDDDAVMRELLTALLEAQGIDTQTAEDASGAFDALSESRPEVVLTDLHLPGVEGAELVGRLRELSVPGGLLLGMSASEPSTEVLSMLDGFLLKPFGVEQVLLAVAEAGKSGPAAATHEAVEQRTEAPVLDMAVYERLSASLPAAALQELYRMSLDDVSKRVETMREAAAQSDLATCRAEAHAIKGGCGMVGAAELKAMAAAIEAGAAVDTPALRDITSACERLRRMLDTLS